MAASPASAASSLPTSTASDGSNGGSAASPSPALAPGRSAAGLLRVPSTGANSATSRSSSLATSVDPPLASPDLPTVLSREELRQKFQNFDEQAVFDQVMQAALEETAQNFVVEFGGAQAWIAQNLTASDFAHLLKSRNLYDSAKAPVRWINIWNCGSQKKTVEYIGHHYGFSERLQLTITAWDEFKMRLTRLRKEKAKMQARRAKHMTGLDNRERKSAKPDPRVLEDGPDEHMRASFGLNHLSLPGAGSGMQPGDAENLAAFAVMQNTLNYTSIDKSSRFVCIGANWLHRRPKMEAEKQSLATLVPPKHWSWITMCHDNTVVSFHAAADFEKAPNPKREEDWKKRELKNMRANTLKVLRQISMYGYNKDRKQVMQLTAVRGPLMDIRHGRTQIPQERHAVEASSSLFYYLFEDYLGAFDVLEESKNALHGISRRILHTTERHKEDSKDIIPVLYKLDKELRQLHHLFSNYKILVNRLLSKDEDHDDYSDESRTPEPAAERSLGGRRSSELGEVGLDKSSSSSSAVVDMGFAARHWLTKRTSDRFKRLQVQMQSLMLDTIKDYLDEKESLQTTYFNLINQRNAQATERLTRSATLLAKLSVFFLPISFMTSYFSVAIPNFTEGYTRWSYWGPFIVISSLSFMGLFFFSKVLMFFSDWLELKTDRAVESIRLRVQGIGLPQRHKKKEEEDEAENED